MKAFIIGVGGGTSSGKTTVCSEIIARLGAQYKGLVTMITQDSFYRELTDEEKALASRGLFNFDHPNAFDVELMADTLQSMRQYRTVSVPSYDYRSNSKIEGQRRHFPPADVVLVEGILVLYYVEIRELFDLKIFVETDPDTRLSRRVIRDTMERGRDLQQVLNQYLNLVKPAYEEFCLPTKKFADVIIPRGGENVVAIDLIVKHILEILRHPGYVRCRVAPESGVLASNDEGSPWKSTSKRPH